MFTAVNVIDIVEYSPGDQLLVPCHVANPGNPDLEQ